MLFWFLIKKTYISVNAFFPGGCQFLLKFLLIVKIGGGLFLKHLVFYCPELRQEAGLVTAFATGHSQILPC